MRIVIYFSVHKIIFIVLVTLGKMSVYEDIKDYFKHVAKFMTQNRHTKVYGFFLRDFIFYFNRRLPIEDWEHGKHSSMFPMFLN